MIGEKELFRIEYYEYGEPYFGSDGGMNYRVAREPLENVHFIPPEKRSAGVLRAGVRMAGTVELCRDAGRGDSDQGVCLYGGRTSGSDRLAQRRAGRIP